MAIPMTRESDDHPAPAPSVSRRAAPGANRNLDVDRPDALDPFPPAIRWMVRAYGD